MKNMIEYTRNIETSFKVRTVCMIVVGAVCVLVCGIAMFRAFAYAREQANQVYVLDEGRSLVALRAASQATTDMEITDHVKTFHSFFFNVAPNKEAIEENRQRALVLADESAAKYWDDLQESGYFNRLIAINATQQIDITDVQVDLSVYPYAVHVYGRIRLIRSSVMTLSAFESTCNVYRTERSMSNPHGLMIEKFFVNKIEETARVNR